jgi:hypothetical protein
LALDRLPCGRAGAALRRLTRADVNAMAEQRPDVLPAVCWPSGPRPGTGDAMVGAVQAALATAAALARAGDYRGARQLCAEVVLDAQPIIAARRELLAAALHALLLAQGFRLLSGLVRAVGGRDVRVVLLPEAGGPVAPPCVRERLGGTTWVLDGRWLDRLSPDDAFLRHWCDALGVRGCGGGVLREPGSVARVLEPV